jgi:cyclopropane-fatty-acyl-phospholipid synthase
VLPAIERSGLIVTDIEILRLHYAETLRHWSERFQNRRPTARAMYGEEFCRMWEFYLAGAEMSFRYRPLMVFQIQLAHRKDAVCR